MGLAAGMLRTLIKRLFTGASIRLSGKATEEPDKTNLPPPRKSLMEVLESCKEVTSRTSTKS